MQLKIVLFLLVLTASGCLAEDAANATETEVKPDAVVKTEEEPKTVEVSEPSSKPAVEPLDIHGLDNSRPIFHQKHQIPNGKIAGTYGYYDSLGRYHVLNYVQDQYGIRITNDFVPSESPGHGDRRPPDLEASASEEDADLRRPSSPIQGHGDPLAESDGDNLLRDEHSIVRTTVVPPPGVFFNNIGYYQGSEAAGSQVVQYNVHRRNGTQYSHNYPQTAYQTREPHRIPYPYENPLYPLLYTDPNKNAHPSSIHDDDINDTSGLDTSDGVSEVQSKPVRTRPGLVQHRPDFAQQYSNYAAYGNSLYSRPMYQQTRYYHQYMQPTRQQYLIQPVHQYQTPVRAQGYYQPRHQQYHQQEQQQQYQHVYYQPVADGYNNRYEQFNYGYSHG